MSELKPCAHCDWPKARLMHKTQYRLSMHGYVAYEWVPDVGFGGDYEREVNVLDFRHRFYVRCNKCGARGGIVSTEWYVTTEEEAEEWSRLQPTFGHEWDSDFAKDAREKAIEAWNTRAEQTCEGCKSSDYWCEECSRNYCDFYTPKEGTDADGA